MSTPKEKAIELFLQYHQLLTGKEWTHFSEAQVKFFSEEKSVQDAKQCAIIATDYLIEETYYEIKNDSRYPLSHREFWEHVKTEIEQL